MKMTVAVCLAVAEITTGEGMVDTEFPPIHRYSNLVKRFKPD